MKIRLGFVSNSSSEAFLIAGKSPKEVERDMRMLLATYNELVGGGLTFEQVFVRPRKATKKDLRELKYYCDSYQLTGLEDRVVQGDTYLRSAQDNSIPYSIIEFIDLLDTYNVQRIHMG